MTDYQHATQKDFQNAIQHEPMKRNQAKIDDINKLTRNMPQDMSSPRHYSVLLTHRCFPVQVFPLISRSLTVIRTLQTTVKQNNVMGSSSQWCNEETSVFIIQRLKQHLIQARFSCEIYKMSQAKWNKPIKTNKTSITK